MDGAEVQGKLEVPIEFGDADKTQAGRVCRTGEQRIHGNTQLNNYLSLFGTRRDQLLVEAKFTSRVIGAGFE